MMRSLVEEAGAGVARNSGSVGGMLFRVYWPAQSTDAD